MEEPVILTVRIRRTQRGFCMPAKAAIQPHRAAAGKRDGFLHPGQGSADQAAPDAQARRQLPRHRQPGRHRRDGGRERRPVPSRHALSRPAGTPGRRRGAAAARLPSRRARCTSCAPRFCGRPPRISGLPSRTMAIIRSQCASRSASAMISPTRSPLCSPLRAREGRRAADRAAGARAARATG